MLADATCAWMRLFVVAENICCSVFTLFLPVLAQVLYCLLPVRKHGNESQRDAHIYKYVGRIKDWKVYKSEIQEIGHASLRESVKQVSACPAKEQPQPKPFHV